MKGHQSRGPLHIAMLSIHSSPLGPLGSRDTGGMSVVVRELARELGAAGHRIDIFTRRQNLADPEEIDISPGVRLVNIRMGPLGKTDNLALLEEMESAATHLRRCRQTQLGYHLIHSHYWVSGTLGSRVQRHWSVPHLATFNTLGEIKNSVVMASEPDIRLRTEANLASTCQRLLVPSRLEKRLLSRCYDIPESGIGIVPCGVDLTLFKPEAKTDARRKIGLDPGLPLLLFVGRFDAMKGLDELIQGMRLLCARTPVQLLLVGGDGEHSPEARRLRDVATANGVSHHVIFGGRKEQAELPVFYSAADVLVLPSLYESFGMVALEAMACGTPVVATRVGAMEAIIAAGCNGMIADSGAPDALAAAITSVLSRRASMRPSAIRDTVRPYTWKSAAGRLLEQYLQTIAAYRKTRDTSELESETTLDPPD
ncbi:MAG: glycosyltransferase [Desulfobacterales bacterium]|jgi:D-inositol-3-phosphate glycosyltransferase